ncbi:hypothetical protein NG800_002205 [Epilithonimonas ginsengisoli]|uniref:Uncharacterized protein n=1 Tax=Epilithonimonas ginsengisoli TaxID=1245592 RepID=A0ABU4JDG4_9FLAO|nr:MULTISPECIES: hypothetical protein [Chryseobacterium group]MBV6878679.1 hypothetical protein [Epilithonimonas sp. FP105]MDW8547705.1 hypothetical protein [Epilithonimonas ginsengisoli]OAH75929.1 hypothetical protein AXA65_02300 [Chryseobacterium sp. FP211-J200]
MKKLLIFLFLIGVLTTFGLTVNSCSKTDKPDHKNQVAISKIDSSSHEKATYFQMPSLQKLADRSPILKAEAFGNENEEIRYIVGDILILLSASENDNELNLKFWHQTIQSTTKSC